MFVRVLKPEALDSAMQRGWDALRAAHPRYRSPYFSRHFIRLLGGCRSDTRVIAAFDEDGVARAFLPIQNMGWHLGRPAGAPFCDNSGPIMADKDMPLLPSILAQAGAAAYRFSGLGEAPHDLVSSGVTTQLETYHADLSLGFDAYLETRRALYPKHFKKARRLGRQAEREAGEVVLRFHQPDPDILDELIGWKSVQLKRSGLHDVYAPTWVRNMLHACLRSDDPDFSGVLTTLHIGDELAAAEFGLRSHDVLHGWVAGFNLKFAAYSPGILLQERLLQAAFEDGVTRADLGSGAEHYKKYYASGQTTLTEGVVHAASLAGGLRHGMSRLWHSVECARQERIAKVAGSARRRFDNIMAVETTWPGRARGMVAALNRQRSGV